MVTVSLRCPQNGPPKRAVSVSYVSVLLVWSSGSLGFLSPLPGAWLCWPGFGPPPCCWPGFWPGAWFCWPGRFWFVMLFPFMGTSWQRLRVGAVPKKQKRQFASPRLCNSQPDIVGFASPIDRLRHLTACAWVPISSYEHSMTAQRTSGNWTIGTARHWSRS